MQSRETRYWLRIESGARQGERVPLGDGVSTLGRAADNPVVLADKSVSGKHAEIRVEDGACVLQDLGSTNGTRVSGKKVESHRLAHGDHFALGQVKLVFEDARLAGPASAPAGGVEEGLGRVTAEEIARSGARSKRGWILVVLLVASLGLLGWRFLGGEKVRARQNTVTSIEGNLLDDFSFESESGAQWESADLAPQGFFRDTVFARSGEAGLGVVLASDEWALARSEEVALRARRFVECRAFLASEGPVSARIGLELSSSVADLAPFIAWAPAAKPTTESGDPFVEVVLGFDTLPDYDRGRVVVAARATGGGSAWIDDVSVVVENQPEGPAAAFHEHELYVLGSPGSTAALVRSGRVLFSGIGFGSWGGEGLVGWDAASWSAQATPNGLALSAAGAPADSVLRIQVNIERGEADEPWLATIGPEGYRSHTTEFEREGAQSLLIGRGLDLMRIGSAEPTRVAGSARNAFLTLGPGNLPELALQLTFQEERAHATELAVRARQSAQNDSFGEALASWSELLDRFPFEAALVAEAESERGRLVQQGLSRVEEIRREVERARFFQLADLFRQSRAHAADAAARYVGSEVEVEARSVIQEIDADLGGLAGGELGSRSQRLRGVLDALDESQTPRLYEHVRAALEEDGSEPKDG